MATVTTYQSASPYSIVASAGSDGMVGIEARATVLAACVDGPLKTLLLRTADWTVFNLGGAKCSLIEVRGVVNRNGGLTSGEANAFRFYWEAEGFKVASLETGQFEIRLQHSERR